MTGSTPDPTFWRRLLRRLYLLASALDSDLHELSSHRIDALERRLAVVEAELGIIPVSPGGQA